MRFITGVLQISAAVALCALPRAAFADAVVGKPAPSFEAKDVDGKTHKLGDYKGKWLVLEWFNKDCPFVRKHYGSGNMQKTQKAYTAKNVQWVTVASSAKGKQGFMEPGEAKKVFADEHSNATLMLLDPSGATGHAYGAKTTPDMFVINPEGVVVYSGAIDDNDSSDPAVIAKSTNLVAKALDEAMAGKKVTTASTRPYGCSVKY